ncbi:hypothetical protein [Lacisediminihabitans sp. H27-G8]|uniref:hypothetical protein n=1 Tax=Lacisediminihabitans sp. H27-G8 TaxID=3111909 RepID=UPI0038FC8BB1
MTDRTANTIAATRVKTLTIRMNHARHERSSHKVILGPTIVTTAANELRHRLVDSATDRIDGQEASLLVLFARERESVDFDLGGLVCCLGRPVSGRRDLDLRFGCGDDYTGC